MLECPASQKICATFQELFDHCEGDMRKLMCHPKQHIWAKLLHKMCVFRDEHTEWLFELQLDRFKSSDKESWVSYLAVMMMMSLVKWILVSSPFQKPLEPRVGSRVFSLFLDPSKCANDLEPSREYLLLKGLQASLLPWCI